MVYLSGVSVCVCVCVCWRMWYAQLFAFKLYHDNDRCAIQLRATNMRS